MVIPDRLSIFPNRSPTRVGTLSALVWDNCTNTLGITHSHHIHLNLKDSQLGIDSPHHPERLSNAATFVRDGLNMNIDAAFSVFNSKIIPNNLGITSNKTYKGYKEPEQGEILFMYGIGSKGRLHSAKVAETDKELELNAPIYDSIKSTGVLLGPTEPYTKNTIFCSPGDSGAIWYNENFEAVGMHVAGHRCDKTNNILPFMYPITKVLEALDVTMLTPEDVANL